MTNIIKKNLRGFTQRHFYNRGLSVGGRSRVSIASKFKDVFNKNGAGFTLIEIIIVVAIIGIMAGLVIVPFGTNRVKKELETNAREFAGVVREAQNYALTGKQVVSNTAPCGFLVTWSGSDYKMTYQYKSVGSETCNSSKEMVVYKLKNGVVFGNTDNVYFDVPHADLNFSGSKGAVFKKQLSNYVVCTYADGRISDRPGTTCPLL